MKRTWPTYPIPQKLLTRDKFREAVFARDGHQCVVCGAEAKDAHHILERRLWPDGGYYLNNGASVCEEHHLQAEATLISCDDLRRLCHIDTIVVPPHFEGGCNYTKWGDVLLTDGMRVPGELFGEDSVQKILKPVLDRYLNRFKYPRTYHLPWSPGATRDDRIMKSLSRLEGRPIVVTEKMDGENTTLYRHGLHARSLNFGHHPSRTRVKAFHRKVQFDIPEGWRVCGENLTAVHSLRYDSLPHFFLAFSIWNEWNWCLSWGETMDYAEMLGISLVPILYMGAWDERVLRDLHREGTEGYVVRPLDAFHYKDFRHVVGKYVRENHVQTDEHWMHKEVELNGFPEDV